MNHQKSLIPTSQPTSSSLQEQFAAELDRNHQMAISQVSFGDGVVPQSRDRGVQEGESALQDYYPGAFTQAIKSVSVKKDLEQ